MIVVSNASPVIFLSKLGALELLAQCFDEVHIPEAVKTEIGDVVLPEFIQVTAISEFGQHYVSGAIGTLHAGELEAIWLTEEIDADLVILDDLRARQKAKSQNQTVTGILGILMFSKEKGFIEKATFAEYLDALVNVHGMWLSEKLLQKLKQ
uniref:DUF3368 domain-containing protein n=1 Tax=uncultured Thiotrichaceae bacterium TaxID=298394 RepID=A0A6S6T1Y9_9GAMM|nr:MAG: Unknown protein [uncultured Thiotrichaceae bacterium]